MNVLALDPGAKRCGWAVLHSEGSLISTQITYRASGILGLAREVKYQEYRLRLIKRWVEQITTLQKDYAFDVVVSETLPPAGGTIGGIINRQLSLTVITTVQALAISVGLEVVQIAASTIKKRIGGHGKASKVKVRDGVLSLLPELEPRRPEWTGKSAVWDEVDALAVGLTFTSR